MTILLRYRWSWFISTLNILRVEQLTLQNFRDELDEKALERGWFYFSKGWVKPPKEILPEYFENIINEVTPHAISYSIDEEDAINDVFCTCGEGPSCRHLAALLYKLEADREAQAPENEHII